MKFTVRWAENTLDQAALVFAAGFLGGLATAGGWGTAAIHGAIAGGVAALASFAQSVIASFIHPPSTNLLTALRTRKDPA